MDHVHWAIDQGINIVVGTSGFTDQRLDRIRRGSRTSPRSA